MADELTIRLPDGSDAGAPRRHDRDRPGRGHRLPPGQGRRDRRRQRRASATSPRRSHDGDEVAIVTADSDRGPVHDPPLDGPRAGPGRARPVPRRHVRHRPAGGGRLLLRLRAARRRHVRGRRPRAHRGPDARDHRRGAAVRPRRAARPSEAREVFADHQLQARDHRRRQHRPDVGHVVARVGPHLREPAARAQGRRRRSRLPGLHRPVPRPARRPTRAATSATSS